MRDVYKRQAFAAALNDGISESGLAETDAYLTSSGTFTSYTAEGLAACLLYTSRCV